MERSILEEAQELTSAERQQAYGSPAQNFGRAARIASALTGLELTAASVVCVMLAVKLSRETHEHRRDNLVDLCGYARILNELQEGGELVPEDDLE